MAQAPNELNAIEALAAMAAGRLTAEALTRACLDRIAARDSVVRAFACLDPERALAEARSRDRARRTRHPRAALRAAVRREGHHRHARHADARTARRFMPVTGRPRTRRALRWRARPAPSCWARPSPRNSRCAIPDRRRTRTIPRTRPADRRADRPPPSPTSWCRWPSARRPAGRSSVPHPIAAWSATSLRSTRSIPTGVKPLAGSFDTVGLFARCVDDCALVVGVLAGDDRSAAPLEAVRARARGPMADTRLAPRRTRDGPSGRDRRAAARTQWRGRGRGRTAGGVRALPRRAKRRAAFRGGARVRVRTDAARRLAFAVEPRGVGGGRGDSAAPVSGSAGVACPLPRAVRGRDRAVRPAAVGERTRRGARRPRQHRRGDVQPMVLGPACSVPQSAGLHRTERIARRRSGDRRHRRRCPTAARGQVDRRPRRVRGQAPTTCADRRCPTSCPMPRLRRSCRPRRRIRRPSFRPSCCCRRW